jgi:hypothetical protein
MLPMQHPAYIPTINEYFVLLSISVIYYLGHGSRGTEGNLCGAKLPLWPCDNPQVTIVGISKSGKLHVLFCFAKFKMILITKKHLF